MTQQDVFETIVNNIDQSIVDIQKMLIHCCIWNCEKCEYEHLCVRERDYEPTREEFDVLE